MTTPLSWTDGHWTVTAGPRPGGWAVHVWRAPWPDAGPVHIRTIATPDEWAARAEARHLVHTIRAQTQEVPA